MVLLSTGFDGAPNQSLTLAWPLYFISHEVLLNRRRGRHSSQVAWQRFRFPDLVKMFLGLVFCFWIEQVGFLGNHWVQPPSTQALLTLAPAPPLPNAALRISGIFAEGLPCLKLLREPFQLIFYFEIIPNSQESCKNSTRNYFPPGSFESYQFEVPSPLNSLGNVSF